MVLQLNTIHDFTFMISFINPARCCTSTTPSLVVVASNASLRVYKPKQHLKQQTGLNYSMSQILK